MKMASGMEFTGTELDPVSGHYLDQMYALWESMTMNFVVLKRKERAVPLSHW